MGLTVEHGHTCTPKPVAGVIKMVQAMRHGVMPTLYWWLSPLADWTSGAVGADRGQGVSVDGRLRWAQVSPLGISGTNAHLIWERPPYSPRRGAG